MKNLLILFCLFLIPNLGFSQNTNPATLAKASKPTEGINKLPASNSNLEQEKILEKYLGISSFDHPELKSRKQKLFNDNPENYNKMLEELAAVGNNTKQTIKKAEYESFPAEKKRYVDTNPEKFIIVE